MSLRLATDRGTRLPVPLAIPPPLPLAACACIATTLCVLAWLPLAYGTLWAAAALHAATQPAPR